jgi:multidrug resistance efflux pump
MWRLAFSLLATLTMLIATAIKVQAQGASQGVESPGKAVAAAPGRIEGSQTAIQVGASITGIVDKIFVRQGDPVAIGGLLLRIRCGDINAQLAARINERDAATALHRKLVNGPRPEDIDVAEAELRLAEARVEEAKARIARSSVLLDRSVGSQATRDADQRDYLVATAQTEIALLRLRLLKAGTREEELAEAKSKMLAAQDLVDATKAELAKCEVRSPINGTVLRKQVSEGELVSLFYPKPLFTIADTQKYRVRAEVDEQDIRRVKIGQKAEIVVNSDHDKRLSGRVTRIAPVMGRRQILTSDPADKSDRDVMEVIVDLDERPKNLPMGLRVSVIFLE